MPIIALLLVCVAVVFSFLAIRARRLIASALWLAGVSALVSVVLFLLGAKQVAVIELSVGAGLVTVLFAFAISVAGDESIDPKPVVFRYLPAGMGLLFVLVLGWYLLQAAPGNSLGHTESTLDLVLWQQRGLDMLVQVVLIFACVLGLLGLLAEAKAPLAGAMAEEVAAGREQQLQSLQDNFESQPENPQ